VRTLAGTLDVFYAERWSGRVRLLDREHVSHAWVPRESAAGWDLVTGQHEALHLYARR
jgi:hypothetical protein